ncbi:uncharacterized protein LOC135810100 [Sycon ciliatum]|uniref:uncharacterized protein LOC135810100 n=1 Tax=Sycon ciliatum TaxID=27933 RepID=UPI0031F64BE5
MSVRLLSLSSSELVLSQTVSSTARRTFCSCFSPTIARGQAICGRHSAHFLPPSRSYLCLNRTEFQLGSWSASLDVFIRAQSDLAGHLETCASAPELITHYSSSLQSTGDDKLLFLISLAKCLQKESVEQAHRIYSDPVITSLSLLYSSTPSKVGAISNAFLDLPHQPAVLSANVKETLIKAATDLDNLSPIKNTALVALAMSRLGVVDSEPWSRVAAVACANLSTASVHNLFVVLDALTATKAFALPALVDLRMRTETQLQESLSTLSMNQMQDLVQMYARPSTAALHKSRTIMPSESAMTKASQHILTLASSPSFPLLGESSAISDLLEMCRKLYINMMPVDKGLVELISLWLLQHQGADNGEPSQEVAKLSAGDVNNFACLAFLVASDSPVTEKAAGVVLAAHRDTLKLPALLNFLSYFKAAKSLDNIRSVLRAVLQQKMRDDLLPDLLKTLTSVLAFSDLERLELSPYAAWLAERINAGDTKLSVQQILELKRMSQ